MNWSKLMVGFSIVAAGVAAWFVCQIIAYYFAQQRCDAEGDVSYGILMQMSADIFKEKYGRYPTFGEFTNLLDLTVGLVPIVKNRGGPARWFYDETSGIVGINTDGKYRVGPETTMDLSETSFRRPTKVQETHFGRVETLDYAFENVGLGKDGPEIIEIITNWYTTNALHLYGRRTVP